MAVRNKIILLSDHVLTAIFFLLLSSSSYAQTPKVVTPEVTYIGQKSPRNSNTNQFIGIPFAKAPINNLRWRAPAPFEHRATTYQATAFKPACYQDSYNIDWYKSVASYFNHRLNMAMPEVSEDCLYLNIWAPSKPKNNRAVMVWIHGGSNKAGWAYEPNYLADNLATNGDVIVVSIAYRLGVFGFLAHPELLSQTDKTNFGLLDQIQALKWLQGNIEYFGGDKNNITLFGESAGAANIGYLISSPLANGLFHKAISQSGGFQLLANSELEQAIELGKKISSLTSSVNIEDLRTRDTAEIWQASKQADPRYDYRMLTDGHFTDTNPISAFADNASVDLLIGTNKHEYYMYQDSDLSKLSVNKDIVSDSLANQLMLQVSNIENIKLAQDWIDTFTRMACPSLKLAELTAKNGHSAWLYRFDRIREGGDDIKAYHGGEIPYVFDSHDHWLPTNQHDIELTEYMLASWTNFAKYGVPNDKKLNNKWLKFNSHQQLILSLDSTIKMIPNKQWKLCQQLWQD